MIGAVAEFERRMTRHNKSKSNNKHLGRVAIIKKNELNKLFF